MQNVFFVIPLIIIALLIFAVALFINNRKKLAAGYDLIKLIMARRGRIPQLKN